MNSRQKLRAGFMLMLAVVCAEVCVMAQQGQSVPMAVSKESSPGTAVQVQASWKGISGQAKLAPQVTTAQGAVKATALVNGAYQGIEVTFSEPIDLKNVDALTFDFQQTVMPGRGGRAAIIIYYDSRNGLMGNFPFGKDEWSQCRVPIDLRTLKSLGKQSSPVRGKVTRILFSMFRNLEKKGQSIGLRNLVFTSQKTGDVKIPVVSYRYAAQPTSGDADCKVLTDGRTEEKTQPYYRQYADEPDIIFDLEAIYWVKKITVSAVAVPTLNFSDVTVMSSHDGKDWKNAAHFSNQNGSGKKQLYELTADKLSVLGRFIRLRLGRNRTDIPIHIAEVSFEGKLPTDKEVDALSQSQYDIGPAMPKISSENYIAFKDGNGLTVYVSRKNGVACQLSKDGKVLVERMFNRYDLYGKGEKLLGSANAYEDKVQSIDKMDGKLVVVTTNPHFPAMAFHSTYAFVDGQLTRSLQVKTSSNRPVIMYTCWEAVLPQDIRRGGLYETWGSSHDLKHKFAEQVPFDFPADTGAVTIFESPRHNLVFLTYRHLYDGDYVQIGSGVVTVAGFGDKRTVFTSTGWRVNDGLFAFGKDCQTGTVESRMLIANGGVIEAFDRYLKQVDVAAFRNRIKRASWLKDIRMFIYQGWEGLWGDYGKQMVAYNNSLIREGLVQYLAMDSNYHWGDFPTKGMNRNLFGGKLSVEELQERDRDIKRAVPSVKIAQYTWLWSASKGSDVFQKHPDWFITHNAQNQEIIFFPGMGVNYYRLVGIPESADEIVKSITDFMNCYNQDVWYLDGGGSPSSIDWPNMRIDSPVAYDRLYSRIRESIQKTNPERAVFFNNPENPLGDIGYLESFGGVMTTNWRDGATWMYKFKLWQRADKLFSPLYIYWLPGVDAAFRQYAVGTGLGLTLGGDVDRRRDVATMQAQQQSRFSRLVSSHHLPNWRLDPKVQLEVMPLTFGPSGWLFMKNHDKKAFVGQVSTDIRPLGLADSTLPVYVWNFTLRPHPAHRGLLGEREKEKNYATIRWASDFIIEPAYIGKVPYVERMKQNVHVASEQLKLLYVTQSPAVVYSVDNLRNQLWLDQTLGVRVAGKQQGEQTDVTVEADRKQAEILVIVPRGKTARQVQINGMSVAAELIHQAGASFVLVPVRRGVSQVKIDWTDAVPVNGQATLAARAGLPGQQLVLDYKLSSSVSSLLSLSVWNGGDLVWNSAVKANVGQVSIVLPKGVTGGDYEARLQSADGRLLASCGFKLAAGTPAIGTMPGLSSIPFISHDQKLSVAQTAAPGVRVFGWKDSYQPASSRVKVDTGKASVTVGTLPMYDNYSNFICGALDVELKRYVKIRLRGNFHTFISGPRHGPQSLHVKYTDPNCAMGLMFDFALANGTYVSRTFAGTGRAMAARRSSLPSWGVGKVPERIGIVSNFAVEEIPEEVFWLDLESLGAPSDWSGRTLVSGVCQNLTPDRWMEVTLLESSDRLPDGVKPNKYYALKGGVVAEPVSYKVPQAASDVTVDAVLKPEEWKNALTFTEFSRLDNPAQFPPATKIMLQRRGDTLFWAAELTETNPKGFTLDSAGKPWYNDGIEIYLSSFAKNRSYVQYIVAGVNKTYGMWYAEPGAGKTRKSLPEPQYKTRLEGNRLFFEVAIPLKSLGTVSDKPIGFNLGRNRMVDGICESYSLVPGRVYLNLTGAKLLFK